MMASVGGREKVGVWGLKGERRLYSLQQIFLTWMGAILDVERVDEEGEEREGEKRKMGRRRGVGERDWEAGARSNNMREG